MQIIVDIDEARFKDIQRIAGVQFEDNHFRTAEQIIAKGVPIEQEPKTEQFAKWVAREIFDEMWEYNKDAFAEIACRKLAKLGIVRAKGDEWELVEPQESEDKYDSRGID